jgi:hypothetical protein
MPVKKVKRKAETSNFKVKAFTTSGDYAYIPDGLKKFCVPVMSIHLAEKNPRINDKASEKLAALIKIHGFRKPIVIDQNREIKAGNTAYKAALLLGMISIPVAQSHFDNEGLAFAYMISDNKASEESLWDQELLKEITLDYDLDKGENRHTTGLTDNDFNRLFDIRKETQVKNIMEVAVSCPNEVEAEKLFNRLTNEGYKCRVLSL